MRLKSLTDAPKYYTIQPDLNSVKDNMVKIAKQLCYSKDIIDSILNASSESEINRAMIRGRHESK